MAEQPETLDLAFRQHYIDLAAERLGGQTLSCSDDFFAGMENLLKPGRGVFIEDKYTDRGKWMDGWESRRSYGRENGREHDWCVIALGVAGTVHGVDIDTNHFKGNAPESVSVEACHCDGMPGADTRWTEILPRTGVSPHAQNLFRIEDARLWTHLRLNMFPDGGIARFRVYGLPEANPDNFLPGELIDLAAIRNGARAILCSDMFFSDKNNLLMPGRGVNMGDGWETKRRRDPGPDWLIARLAFEGNVQRVVVDTCHFKGNFPDRFSLEGTTGTDEDVMAGRADWTTIITETRLYANREHEFRQEILVGTGDTFSHVRLSIYPDGGVSRLRVFGHASTGAAQ